MKKTLSVALVLVMLFSVIAFTSTEDVFTSAGDRLSALQNLDGTWDWPLDDGTPLTVGPVNTIGPIATGLTFADQYLGGNKYSANLIKSGVVLLSKINNFSPSDGYLANVLDSYFGVTTYTNHIKANFYDQLEAGTYNRNGAGILYDTASYIESIHTSRAAWGGGNLAAWDIAMGLVGAYSAGVDISDWIAGTKTEANRLTANAWYDTLGLAGIIYASAKVAINIDPTTGSYASANSTMDLANILLNNQLASGAFSWLTSATNPDDATSQETAYAILALNELDRTLFLNNIQSAADWFISTQLLTGGWENYAGGGENNEVTAESIWGIYAVYLESVWVDALNGNNHNFGISGGAFATIQKGINTIQGFGGTVEIAPGIYAENLIVSAPVKLFSEHQVASNTLINGSLNIQSSNVRIGKRNHGFSFNNNIVVNAGIDASDIFINWNDIYGLVINNGLGTLDATFNYWDIDGPDTVGDVCVFPYLPAPVDVFSDFITTNNIDIETFLDWFYKFDVLGFTYQEIADMVTQHGFYWLANYYERLTFDIVQFATNKFGLTREEALGYLRDYGSILFSKAVYMSDSFDDLLLNLMGWDILPSSKTPGMDGQAVVLSEGDVLSVSFAIYHPYTREQLLDPNFGAYAYLVQLMPDGTKNIVADFWSYIPVQFDKKTGNYFINMPTIGTGIYGPGPGVYALCLNLTNPGNDFGGIGQIFITFEIVE